MRRRWVVGLASVLVASLRLGSPACDEPPRAATNWPAQSADLVLGIGLALCRLGCRGTVHRPAQRSRCGTPVELVATPARLDYCGSRPRPTASGDHDRAASGPDNLRSHPPEADCAGSLISSGGYQSTRTWRRHCSTRSSRPSALRSSARFHSARYSSRAVPVITASGDQVVPRTLSGG